MNKQYRNHLQREKVMESIIDERAQKLVTSEVRLNVSQLIMDLLNAGLYHDSCSFAELYSDILARDDYEEPVFYFLNTKMDRGELEDVLCSNGYAVEESETQRELAEAFFQHLKSEGEIENFAHSNDIDPDLIEAYEHWVVSDWLADKLEARGKMINRDVHGLTVWGRTTSGQAIYCDSVIREITQELLESR